MHPAYKIHTNPWLIGIATGQTVVGLCYETFEFFTCGLIGLCCFYTAWWIEKKYYPEYKGENV